MVSTVLEMIKEPRHDKRLVTATLPGLIEQTLVVATMFVALHGFPLDWFQYRSELLAQGGTARGLYLTAFLACTALVRLLPFLDDLIDLFRLEPTIFLYSIWALVGLFWSADPATTLLEGGMLTLMTLYAGYLVLRFSVDQILFLLALMFSASAVINMFFIYGLPHYGIDLTGSLTGVFFQKNALGFCAAIGVPTLLLVARTGTKMKIPFYLAALIQTYMMFGSRSKTMLLACLGTVGLMIVYRLFRGRRTLRGAVILSLGSSSLFTVAFATANIALLARWLDKDVTLTGRTDIWLKLLPLAQERFFIGHGFGATFAGYFSPIHEVWVQTHWQPSHAHNAVLQIILEIGIIGLLLWGISFFRAIKRAIEVINFVPGSIGIWPLTFLSTTTLISITESGVTDENTVWIMYCVAVLATAYFWKRETGRI